MDIARCNFADKAELSSVHALQRAAYAIEAELIGCLDIPGLRETEAELARSAEECWGCFVFVAPHARRCLGIVSIESESNMASGPGRSSVLRIARLAVDPAHFRQGMGRLLVGHVLAMARSGEPSASGVVVSTGAANVPGRRLYESLGFALAREFATPDGSVPLVEYRIGG